MKRRRSILIALSLLSSAAFIAVAVQHLRLTDVRRAYEAARLWPWLPLAVVCYLAGHLVRGVRCRLFVSREVALSLPSATNVVVLGYAVNNILPARLGEFARAGMLSRLCGLPFAQCLTITFMERVLDGLALLVLLVCAAATFPDAPWVAGTLRAGAIVFGTAAAGILLALLMPSFLLGVTSRIAARFGDRVHAPVLGLVSQIIGGISCIRDARTAWAVALLSPVVWLFEAGMFWCLLPAFGIVASPGLATLTMTVTNFGILVPSSPGFVGSFHFFCMRTLVLAGVSESTAFGYAVLAHLSFYVPITLWGIAILVGYGIRLGTMAALAAEARPLEFQPGQPAERPAQLRRQPRVLAGIAAVTEAFLPIDEDGISGDERAAVVDSVTRFVSQELGDLPGHLGWLLGLGMLVFRVATLITHRRDLSQLGPAERRRWVEAWAFGRLRFARQLFRAIRSTALLAYYEHPSVRARLDRPALVMLRASSVG